MNKFILPCFWLTALFSVFILSDSFNAQSLHFFGIAGQREQTIRFQYPVEIVQVFVVEGEQVEQGKPILELRRHQLDTDLITIDQQIRQYQLQKQETNNNIKSNITRLTAKNQVVIADVDYQIHTLQQRLKINAQALKSISGMHSNKNRIVKSIELQDLEKKRHYANQAFQVEIKYLTEKLNTKNRPIDAQLNELQHRKQALRRQNVALKVTAQFDGRIGTINYKAGEMISPFQTIVSIHSQMPRFVKGFIHENILNNVAVGQNVWVTSISLDQNKKPLAGVVQSLGNRIVEYPQRLQKNPVVQAWGREVIVRLDSDKNALLFGEKVQVALTQPKAAFTLINHANAQSDAAFKSSQVQPIQSSNPKINADKIEASGVVWHSGLKHYLLISDEQYPNQKGIFIMDKMGEVSAELILKNDLKINDIESISTDAENVYILSSLSHSKKGKLNSKRKKLIRFNYQNHHVTQQQEIDLYKVLKGLKNSYPSTRLSLFLKQAIDDHSLDIESHFVHNNQLYLGFKSPFERTRNTIIIKINNVDKLFAGQDITAEIWKSIQLLDSETGDPMRLTDMILLNNELLMLSTSRTKAKNSVLWRYRLKDYRLEDLEKFPNLQAEGISYRPDQSLLTVVFDEGENTYSKYQSIPYPFSRSTK